MQQEDKKEFCKKYLKKFAAYVSIETMESEVLKSVRVKRVTFSDQLATVGGTLGLFSGMSIISIVEIICFIVKLLQRGGKSAYEILKNKKITVFSLK